MIDAILIDPAARTVTSVPLDDNGTSRAILADYYRLVGCDIVEAIRLPHGDMGFIDEEGLLKRVRPASFVIYGRRFVGRMLIHGVRYNGDTDYPAKPKHSPDLVRAVVAWES